MTNIISDLYIKASKSLLGGLKERLSLINLDSDIRKIEIEISHIQRIENMRSSDNNYSTNIIEIQSKELDKLGLLQERQRLLYQINASIIESMVHTLQLIEESLKENEPIGISISIDITASIIKFIKNPDIRSIIKFANLMIDLIKIKELIAKSKIDNSNDLIANLEILKSIG